MQEVVPETQTNSPALDGLTVLIADAQHLVRGGLKMCVEAVDHDVAVLEADTLVSAVETFRSCPEIDLVLLDLAMTGLHGSSALESFMQHCPHARVVVVSSTHDMKSVQGALAKGVRGFLPKNAGRSAFVNAIRFVLGGGIYIPAEALLPEGTPIPAAQPNSTSQALEPALTPEQIARGRAAALRGARLTARQIDVLAQLLDGKANKQICRELNLAMGTVKCHVGAILGALEVNSRAEAIAAANKRGWREWLIEPRSQGRHHA
ncbi:response regulator transcription factor [Caenimonas sp. SL110]|uniref:LuxR C-terminal-related transcriptional regulator n=1 Tax=Caenimonas sp. SL110 TaxID=1450524 RepID=UPI0013791E25|nr:response regulator transcription factor [Caenimonas sp. SL110]